jgi:hypothetical protein
MTESHLHGSSLADCSNQTEEQDVLHTSEQHYKKQSLVKQIWPRNLQPAYLWYATCNSSTEVCLYILNKINICI